MKPLDIYIICLELGVELKDEQLTYMIYPITGTSLSQISY